MVTTWFPTNQADEAAKITATVTKLPPYIKKWQELASTDEKGLKSYSIIYVDDKNIAEAQLWIAKVMSLYHGLEGFSWKLELVMSQRDALKIPSVKV